MEWGEEALRMAVDQDKPILVSIGYSACHWCHVMEHESFEDKDIASLMNEHFVCIKVDREERPDVDQLYMDAVQAMGISGGWPLNVFLTPHQAPFYAGTYFRPVQWSRLLHEVGRAFRERRQEVDAAAEDLRNFLNESQGFPPDDLPEAENMLDRMVDGIVAQYDPLHGGQDKAPRFPMPSIWQFLLRASGSGHSEKVRHTLTRMALGGIYDQIGGGFARYSVDGRWFAPHFEKMLYDNGQLLGLYAEAYRVFGDPLFEEVIRQTTDWLLREMSHPDGGFFSALDADSEGQEGRFYCWTTAELTEALGERSAPYIACFGCTQNGNWEHGLNILTNKTLTDRPADWRWATRKLLEHRNIRIRPGTDDKVITSWNGMAIVGLTEAALALGEQPWLDRAEQAFHFLKRHLTDDHKIFRSYRDRQPVTEGFLDDYAWYIRAALSLFDATFRPVYLQEAVSRLGYVLNAFADPEHPLFYYSSRHAPELVARRKEVHDNVVPSSNAVLADVLLRTGALTGRADWQEIARDMVRCVTEPAASSPAYMCGWGMVIRSIHCGFSTVAILDADPQRQRMVIGSAFLPDTLFATRGAAIDPMVPWVQDKNRQELRTTFYVCRDQACLAPVHTVDELKVLLGRI